MLTNPNTGGWTDDVDTITAAQIGSIATQLPNALDAIGGGTYTPAGNIILAAGGAHLNLNCDVNHGGTSLTTFGASTALTLAGSTTVASGASVTVASGGNVVVASGGTVSFASGSSFATVSGSTAIFNGTFRANNTARFDGVATFNAAATFNADADFTADVVIDGDLDVAGTLTSAFQFNSTGGAALTGATTSADFTMTSTNKVKLASRSISRTVTAAFAPATTNWTYLDQAGTPSTTNTSSAYGWFHLNLPEGAVLQTVSVYVEGASGHGGAPAAMPHIQLFSKVPSAGGNGTSLAAATNDVFSTVGAYEAVHAITKSSIGYTVTRAATRLCVLVAAEGGAGSVAGFIIHGCLVTYTTTSMDDGPCN